MATSIINGAALEVSERGSGPTVVLVHGSASDLRTWSGTVEALGGQYRVIAYSRRFHRPNDRIPDSADYAMGQQVDDLEALLHSLGGEPVHLVGHSYGAFMALLLAQRAPHLVRTLVLGEPPVLTLMVSDPPTPGELLRLLLTRPRAALAIVKFGATGVSPATKAARRGEMGDAMRIFGRAVLGPEYYARLSSSRLEQVLANAIAAEFLGSGFMPLSEDEVRRVHTPTLLVSGERSPAIFHRLLDRLDELLPFSERIEIPGASHIMHEDNAAAYHAALCAFLGARRGVVGR